MQLLLLSTTIASTFGKSKLQIKKVIAVQFSMFEVFCGVHWRMTVDRVGSWGYQQGISWKICIAPICAFFQSARPRRQHLILKRLLSGFLADIRRGLHTDKIIVPVAFLAFTNFEAVMEEYEKQKQH